MATIGQTLTTPENGWRRYDNTDSRIKYNGTWVTYSNTGAYNGSINDGKSNNTSSIKINFYGTKIRILSYMAVDKHTNNIIVIDGISYTFSENSTTDIWQGLCFEKIDLSLGIHTIIITVGSDKSNANLDAIDIDSTGYLCHPTLNQVSDITTMQIGDCIPCRYTSGTSGSTGYFSELGTCMANEIPISGTAIPDGLFYFIKTDKGTLVADRVIQTNISWDTLNTNMFIEGNVQYFKIPLNSSAITIISYSSMWSGYNPILMFDNISDNVNNGWHPADNSNPNNCTFLINKILSFDQIVLNCRDNSYIPKNFKIYGIDSNNNAILLNYTSYSNNDKMYINFNTTINIYSKFKISMDAGYFCIEEFEFRTKPCIIIRSLTGGVAYIDSTNNASITDKGLGACPANNEWDTYIVKSDLNGKITPGDDNIWHINYVVNSTKPLSWCKETPMTGVINLLTSVSATNTYRIYHGINLGHDTSNIITNNIGFRPVLEYLEPNSKATNLWY